MYHGFIGPWGGDARYLAYQWISENPSSVGRASWKKNWTLSEVLQLNILDASIIFLMRGLDNFV